MKVKFTMHFKYGDVNWYNKDHWEKFTVDDILRCLIDFTDVKEFQCEFNSENRSWDAKLTIPPMTTTDFVTKFEAVLEKLYKTQHEVDILVSEVKLEKGEVSKFTTALLMKKIEGSK